MIQRAAPLVEQLRRSSGKAEIVNGRIVPMSPAGYRHHRRANRIVRSLEEHERTHGGGAAFGDNLGFLVNLANRQSFSPDAGWITPAPADDHDDFIEGPPTFAVEVRSKRDYGAAADVAVLAKVADYFAAGTLVVWDVDLLEHEVIRCYRSSKPEEPDVFERGMWADAEPAVVGWRFEVEELFR